MYKKFSLAYSPCPNDTYIFHAMTHGLVNTEELEFIPALEDVETLNQAALKSCFDITKLSYAAFFSLRSKYTLLKSGSALGRGCGPIIVKRKETGPSLLSSSKMAVPGFMTTAFMLLSFYLGSKPEASAMSFEKIMPAVANGDFDFGLIIHEGRFTYHSYGLEMVCDLGKWWESFTGLPIPLGCIAIKKEYSEFAPVIEKIIADSITFAKNNHDVSRQYIKKHAQEMDDNVIEKHINLYVNDYSLNLGIDGKRAVEKFIGLAEEKGF